MSGLWIAAGVVVVALALVACLAGEVMGLNGRLDAADEEDRYADWLWPVRIDDERNN